MKFSRHFKCPVCFLLFLFFFGNVLAQQFALKKYTQASGLASNFIFDLLQDRDGFIWIATDKGVSRFDGHSFRNFTKTDGLSANQVYCIFQDKNANLWFGTYDGGVVFYDHKKFSVLNKRDGLLDNSVLHITQDKFGRMYFMTDSGLTVYRDSIVANYKNKGHQSGNLFLHPSGKIFYNIDNELFRITPKAGGPVLPEKILLSLEESGTIGNGSWASPLLTMENKLLFPGRRRYLEMQLDEAGQILEKKSINTALFAILEDHTGNLWFAERNGVRVVSGQKNILISKEQGLDPDYIESLLEDSEGNIWLGTMGGGLYKYKGDHIAYFTEKSGLVSNFINTVFEDSAGRILVGSANGLTVIDSRLHIRNISCKMKPSEVLSIAQTREGKFYIGTFEKLYGPLSRSLQTANTKQERVINSGVSSIYIDAEDAVWVSTYGMGVIRIKDNSKTFLTKADGLPANVIEEIVPGADALWFLSRENGAARLKGDSIRIFSRKQGLPSEAVYSLLEEPNGALWFGTDRGLTRLFKNRIKTYSRNQGLIGNYVLGIFKDENRYLIVSDKALHFLEKEQLSVCAGSALLPDKETYIKKVFFSKKTKTIWLATNGGVVRIDLKKVKERKKWLANQHPNIILTQVKSDTSILYKYTGSTEIPEPGTVKLNYNQNNIQFVFNGISYLGEAPLHYQYRLQGADEDWSAPATDNEVTYRSLEPGKYVFYVQVINSAGIYSAKAASYSFTVLPPFWIRPWFLIPAIAVAIALLVLFVYYLTTQKYRKNIRRLQQESALREERLKTRARIASELHDDVASTLSSISLFTESLKYRIKKEPENSEKLLVKLNSLTREAQETMEEVVWSLSPHHDSLQELIQRICDFTSEICCDNDLTCKINLLESDINFPIEEELRKSIYLIVKEAVHNIFKHARASAVKLTVGIENDCFVLNICDDGRGFNRQGLPKKSRGGHGLLNMEKRARQINSVFVLTSEAGKGTCVSLHKEIAQMRH